MAEAVNASSHALQADRQEALVKAEQRRMAIERANKMLFDDTDDIKALHGKLLLSEVGLQPGQPARQHAAAVCKHTQQLNLLLSPGEQLVHP